MKPKVPNSTFCTLARTYTQLCEALRIARNKPLPGQFRPDLDTTQLTRAIKRARARTFEMPKSQVTTTALEELPTDAKTAGQNDTETDG